jgi:hypothetical protein
MGPWLGWDFTNENIFYFFGFLCLQGVGSYGKNIPSDRHP